MASINVGRSVVAGEWMNKQLPFRFIIQFDCLRNGVIILSCMTRMLRSYSALLGKNDNLAIVDTLLSFFGIIGTLLKASILTDSVVPWFHNELECEITRLLICGLRKRCFECSQCLKPIFGTNDECWIRQLWRITEEGTRTMTMHWNYSLCTPSQLWMWEMDISASGQHFSIPTCSHIVYIAWGSMGRWWNATEVENWLLFVFYFLFLNKSNESWVGVVFDFGTCLFFHV